MKNTEFILGELKLLEIVGSNKHKKRIGKYRCFCGKTFETLLASVKNKLTQSCGCYSSFNSKNNHLLKHGESSSRLSNIRSKIRQRCTNPNCEDFYNYGGRGITVCEEWRNDFTKFRDWALANGYSDELEIDRIDVNGNYEPSNCRWVNESIQRTNQRINRVKKSALPIGVSIKNNGRYQSSIGVKYKRICLGTFDTIEEASEAYQKSRKERDEMYMKEFEEQQKLKIKK